MRYKQKKCIDCNNLYNPTSSTQIRCIFCGKKRKLFIRRKWNNNNKYRINLKRSKNGYTNKTCLMCKIEYKPITGNQKMCRNCILFYNNPALIYKNRNNVLQKIKNSCKAIVFHHLKRSNNKKEYHTMKYV